MPKQISNNQSKKITPKTQTRKHFNIFQKQFPLSATMLQDHKTKKRKQKKTRPHTIASLYLSSNFKK